MESEEESEYRRRDKFRSERSEGRGGGREMEPDWRRSGPTPPACKVSRLGQYRTGLNVYL